MHHQQHILHSQSSVSVYLMAAASPYLLSSSSISDLVRQNQIR